MTLIGISPLTWTNDDLPSLGGDIPLETCLAQMAEAGFCGTELGTKYPREAGELLPLLDRYGLVLASGWCSGNLLKHSVAEELDAIGPHVRLLKTAGCRVMVYGEISNTVHGRANIPLSKRVRPADDQWKAYGRKLTEVATRLYETEGLRLAYHHHVGTIVETPDDVDRLLDNTGPSVFITFDTGHVLYGGGDPAACLRRWGPRIAHVHLKDVRLPILAQVRTLDSSFLNAVLEGVFTVPGDGDIDFEPILAALVEMGYEGWFLVEAEQDPAKAEPSVYAHKAFANVTRYLRGAGFPL